MQKNLIIDEKFVELYPNPAQDQLYITQNYAEKVHIKIMDMNGKILKSSNIEYNTHLDISDLSNGVYIIVFEKINLTPIKFVKL